MKYDVYGMGNAIVDIVTEVEDDFFRENAIEKGAMTLVDEKRQIELMRLIDMKTSKISGGGSVGNTIAAIGQFGGKTFYSCLVAQDEIGQFFLEDLKKNGVATNLVYKDCPPGHSGRCLVMTSPDTQRTMNTFLGVNAIFSSQYLDEEAIRHSSYLYMEGYPVSNPDGPGVMKDAKKIAQKYNVPVALTFSDPAMVKYFSSQMNEVVGTGVDLLFCNEEEAMIFTGTTKLHEAREKLKDVAKRFAITLGPNGAMIYDGDTFVQIEPYQVQAVDSNGAGDMFSGAFMYGITHHHSYAEAGKLASMASSRVVSKWGPRLDAQEAKKILKELTEI